MYIPSLYLLLTKFFFSPCMLDDTTMLWGVKPYYDLLMQAGPLGNVQGELIVRKDFRASSTTNNNKGRAFPVRVYFNGDNCVMPPPDAYPVSITA